MLKDKDLLIYLDRPEAGLSHWALRDAVKAGRELELDDVRVTIGNKVRADWNNPEAGKANYMVWIKNEYSPGLSCFELLAFGYVGETPMRFSLCGLKAGPMLFAVITWLRFLGLSMSMTDTGSDWEEVYLDGLPVDAEDRNENKWIDIPPRAARKELN